MPNKTTEKAEKPKNRAERTREYFEEYAERIDRLLALPQSTRLAVAEIIHQKMEPRPYTASDFERKEFHSKCDGTKPLRRRGFR